MEKDQQTLDAKREQRNTEHRRWNLLSGSSFVIGATLSLLTMANSIRYTFWHNFVQGFGEVRTPFSDIKDKYAKVFKNTVAKYERGALAANEYSATMRETATNYRQEVFNRLEKDFNIPSNGWRGWTEGTLKRWKELGVTARIHNTVGIASITATTIGAVIILARQQRNTNRVEDKLDQSQTLGR